MWMSMLACGLLGAILGINGFTLDSIEYWVIMIPSNILIVHIFEKLDKL